MEKNDGLPSILCKKCTAKLRLAYDFKKQTEKSDKHLRSFILDVNKKFQLVTKTDEQNDIDDELSEIENELIDYENDNVNDDESNKLKLKVEENSYTVEDVEELGDNTEQMVVMIVNEEEVALNDGCYTTDDIQNEEYTEIESITQIDDPLNELNESNDRLYEEHLDSAADTESSTVESAKSTPRVAKKRKYSRKPELRVDEHVCPKCDKTFSTRTNLTRHLLTHEGQKPYVCDVCGSGFTQNGSLKSHMVSTMKILKPFKLIFTHFQYIHTGERPFACHLCPKAFTQSKSLLFHMRRRKRETKIN